ncbi:MAG: ATP-binding protein [Candidatus Omnitrophica bacterium]|nr:ATP-binding protein [Candidatus Omnitrophota bacterium]
MSILSDILRRPLIKRDVLPQIIKWIAKKEAVILTGSRQVGKTCLLYLLIQHLVKAMKIPKEDIFYFDLERIENLEMLNAGVDEMMDFINEQNPKRGIKYVFIDEIQYLDNPSNLLKILVDHYSDRIKVFATGSSALTIKKKFRDSLVGRKVTFEVYSLNFREYLSFKKQKNLYDIINRHGSLNPSKAVSTISHNRIIRHYFEYAIFGGYPAVVLLKEYSDKKKYLSDIYSSYVRKDINAIFSLENTTAFNKIVKLLALNIGNLVNIQEFSKDAGIARQTVEKYFSILENTYICKFIQPYFTNKKKEIVKMSKVYFYDTGLRNRIINDFRKMEDRVDAGFLIENVVFKNLLKRVENKENIKFWRMKYGVEVDFVIDEEKIIPLEVKFKDTDRVPAGMASFLNNYKSKEAIVVNRKRVKNTGRVKFLPFYML